ncbi:MAG: right-handed parallel beta-helix repeat-containing protein [Sideroxyarcus sp.]|nr:right-handed parallel beta-helix repeat-containing protein [Sideroxyarcus sp.]
MKAIFNSVRGAALLLLATILVSCGGGSSTTPTPPTPPDTQSAYYIDADSGSDLNTGFNSTSAWKSLAQIAAAPVPAGSTIYLKRGSVWYEQLTLPDSLITIDAYGDSALSLPRIDGSRLVGSWTDEGGGIYSAAVTLAADEGLGNLSVGGVMMPFLAWDTDAATTFASAADGTFSYRYPDTLFIKSAAAPSGVYRASVKFFGITAEARSDIIVRNVETRRFSLHGINFKDCLRCEVHGAVVSQGGGATIAAGLYAGNGIEFGNNSSNGLVDGAVVGDIFDSGISPQTYASNKTLSSITIKNSTIDKCGFAGVEVSVLSNGGTTGSSITGLTLSGLTITNAGKGWSGRRYGSEGNGIRIKADAGAGTMSNVQIDTTTVDGAAWHGIVLAGEIGTVNLHRMNIKNNGLDGIALDESSATGLKLHLTSSLVHDNGLYGFVYDSLTADGFELYQNTFSNNAGANLAVVNTQNTASKKVQNNLFYGSTRQIWSLGGLDGGVIDNNCYNNFANMFMFSFVAYNTVEAFHTAYSAYETSGAGGTVGLTDTVTGDFSLSSGSVCKTLGNASVGVTTDYSGSPFANPPSSGAYQYH